MPPQPAFDPGEFFKNIRRGFLKQFQHLPVFVDAFVNAETDTACNFLDRC
jgi:hypothetical protein